MSHIIFNRAKRQIASIVVVAATLFLFAQCKDSRYEYGDGVLVNTRISFSVPPAEVKEPLRMVQSPEDESTMHNVLLFVFDKTGSTLEAWKYINEPAINYKTIDMTLSRGEKMFVAIANIADGTQVQPDLNLNKSDFIAPASGGNPERSLISNVSQLKEKIAAYKNATSEMVFRLNPIFLMASPSDLLITVTGDGQNIEIPVQRAVAKIEFKLSSETSSNFIPESWQVVNVPKKTYMIGRADRSDDIADDAAGKNMADDYFTSNEYEFEGSGYGNRFAFYQFENRKYRKEHIGESDPTKAYRQRAQYNKQDITPVQAGGADRKNLNFHYAPDYCTYVVIKGRFEGVTGTDDSGNTADVIANVQYTIPLGYVNGNADDYAVERNTHYIYTITVKGVKDIIVEAQRLSPETYGPDSERYTQVEGNAAQRYNNYKIDSHYDQLRWIITEAELRNMNPDEIYCVVKTPFGSEEFTIASYDADPALKTRVDALCKWVEFRQNPMTKRVGRPEYYYWQGTQDQIIRYPSLNAGGLPAYNDHVQRDVRWFMGVLRREYQKLITNASDLYTREDATIFDYQDASTATGKKAFFTVYFDEYVYETHPLTGQKVEWEAYVNKPPRTMTFYKKRHLSRDGKSVYYSEPFIRFEQLPIYTVFIPTANGYEAYGMESINELGFTDGYTSAASQTPIDYLGWTHWTDLLKLKWSGILNGAVKWGDLMGGKYTDQDYWPHDWVKSTLYGCLLRNRDNNQNNVIDNSEIRWYLPDIGQLIETGLCEQALPPSVRLWNSVVQTGDRRNYSFVSSSIGNTTYQNPYYLWSSQSFAINADYRNGLSGAALYGYNKNYSHRCFRNLGRLPGTDKYAEGSRIMSGVRPASGSDPAWLELVLANPHLYRPQSEIISTGEVPPHDIWGDHDRPTYSFWVAKQNVTGWSTRANITAGNPCSTYKEGRFDKPGDWRMPTFREMGFIMAAEIQNNGIPSFWSGWASGQQYLTCTNTSTSSPDGYMVFQALGAQGSFHIWSANPGTSGVIRCVKDKN